MYEKKWIVALVFISALLCEEKRRPSSRTIDPNSISRIVLNNNAIFLIKIAGVRAKVATLGGH